MALNVLLVGYGKMGSALAQRWQHICSQLVILDPVSQPLKSFKDVPSGFKPHIVVFAVKPQTLNEMAGDYRIYAEQGALMLSIAAGKPIAFFEKHLGTTAKIIRSMPNTPAAIGKGITVAYANKHVSALEKEWAAILLGAVGEVLWVEKESLLDPVIALSGSGPAYIFLLIETLSKAGTYIGLDPQIAEKLARCTVIGSAALADENSTLSAEKLRQDVTSPGGTTQAALEILMAQPGIQELFDKALAVATKRAKELSQ